jgi:hypothetical protein
MIARSSGALGRVAAKTELLITDKMRKKEKEQIAYL